MDRTVHKATTTTIAGALVKVQFGDLVTILILHDQALPNAVPYTPTTPYTLMLQYTEPLVTHQATEEPILSPSTE